jgi:hypothetical protein
MGNTIESVAEELDLPKSLVREWHAKLDPRDLTSARAHTMAVAELMSKPLQPGDPDQLKLSLERTAEELSRQIYASAPTGDVFQSKALQQLCDGVAKLYGILILKGGTGQGDAPPLSSTALSAFKLRD